VAPVRQLPSTGAIGAAQQSAQPLPATPPAPTQPYQGYGRDYFGTPEETGQVPIPFTGKLTQSNLPVSDILPNVRYNNPGAMFPSRDASYGSRKFGSSGYGIIGGGKQIAYFDNPIHGAAGNFDLLANGTDYKGNLIYRGSTVLDAIKRWSGRTGGEANTLEYAKKVAAAGGLKLDSPLTLEFIQGPGGIAFMRQMARWEGKDALSANDWNTAQQMAFPSPLPPGQPSG
jgi:hypothetical protein